jgi:hypothetical protein
MQTVYIGNTLINDIFLGSQRMEDALQNTNLTIDWLLVGGGGSGGTYGSRNGGSGGAGRFVSSSANITPQSISITIGNGGAGIIYDGNDTPGNGGNESTIVISGTTYIAYGGGYGGGGRQSGGAGGSGGGAGGVGLGQSASGGSNTAGSPISGFGNNGESRSSGQTTGGLGGGAGGTPTGLAWLDGITYSIGGGGGGSTAGCGGAGAGFGGNSGAGNNGIVKIRYYGTPKATGGTITQSGGYTYHTFTSNGTFTY